MVSDRRDQIIYALCGAAFAALLALSWPKADIGALAWFAPAPFAWAVLKCRNAKTAAVFGLFSGLLFYCSILYWIYPTCRAGGAGAALSALAWFALSLTLALEWATLAVILKCFASYGRRFPPLAAAALVAVEYTKVTLCKMAVWFPWFLLGYTQWKWHALLQLAAWTGVYGVSFVVALFGFSLGYAVYVYKPSPEGLKWPALFAAGKEVVTASVLVALLVVCGHLRLAPAAKVEQYPASIIQPNIYQYQKWDAAFEQSILERISSLCSAAKNETVAPQLIVLPESALPGPLEEEPLRSYAGSLARDTKAWQVLGSERKRDGNYFVSAYLLDPAGNIAGVYDKRQLVPFGEFVPFGGVLGKFIKPLAHLGGFSQGEHTQRIFNAGGYKIGVGICYEAIFPYLWRGYAREDADLLVNITNDGWYLDTAAPYQHFTASVFRAVENGRPFLRAANTGVSALIDSYGRVVSSTALNTAVQLPVSVPRFKQDTFYVRHGSLFAQLAYGAAFMALLVAVLFA